MTLYMKLQEAREEGIKIGILQTLTDLVKDGIITLSVAAEKLSMTVEEFQKAMTADFPPTTATTESTPPHAEEEEAEDTRQNV